jgi:Tol biopolymer transport system component
MNPDGTSPVNITNTPSLSETSGSWSPDGTEIVFRESTTNQIGRMNADGKGYAFITAFTAYGLYYPCFEGKPR